MTSQRLVDRQKEGGGRRMMKESVQEKKEEPSSLKGHWPLSSFPPPCTARPLTRRLEAQPYLGRAAERRRPAGVGLVSRNFSNTSVTSLPIQQNVEGARQQPLVPRLHRRPHRGGRVDGFTVSPNRGWGLGVLPCCSGALQHPGMCVSPHRAQTIP